MKATFNPKFFRSGGQVFGCQYCDITLGEIEELEFQGYQIELYGSLLFISKP